MANYDKDIPTDAMLFNPNSTAQDQPRPTPFDFQKRQAAIEGRKAKIAQLMKNQKFTPDMPEGQMVSGHYVVPHWSQYLAAGMQPYLSQRAVNQEQEALGKEQSEFSAADRQAAIEHAASMPQGRPEQAGPPLEGGSPELAAQPVTPQQKIQWAEQGMNIPSRRDLLSKLVTDLTINEPVRAEARGEKRLDREDRQTEARANLASNQQLAREKLEQQGREAAQRSQDTNRGIEERRDAAREAHGIMLQLGQLRAETAEKANAAKQGKLSDKARSDLDAFEGSNLGLANAITALKGASDKGTGWLAGEVQNRVPGGQSIVSKYRDQATNDAIQQTTYWTDEIRHGRFGTALTAPEKASAAQYLPGEHDDLGQIIKKAEGLQKLLLLNHRRLQLQAGDTPLGTPKTASSGPVTATPVRVNSVAEAMKLPPGTKFIDPNGVQRTR